MKPDMDHETKVSRRRFFTTAGSFVTGAMVTAAGCSMAAKKEPVAEAALPVCPYPYVKLDPEEVRKRAYAGYYQGK